MTSLMFGACIAFGLFCTFKQWPMWVVITGGLVIGTAIRVLETM